MTKQRGGTPLAAIIAYARAGALDHAWREFVMAGHADRGDDGAALAVKGRLLKDRALRADGEQRRRLLHEAARAYRASAEVQPATYPLINAATLNLLAGDTEEAAHLAREVLERIEAHPDEPETPYWLAATRAEALLLLGHVAEAKTALTEAIKAAPQAWEDHASTLRQFAVLLAEVGEEAEWLDSFRPPVSLHFAGHMSFRPDVARPALEQEVAGMLDEERAGFAFGALAAGADIIVAEAVLARGAELHVVLPSGVESFARHSVAPYGEDWRRRFEAALAAAASVRIVRPFGDAPDGRAIALADEIAMGAALMNAERLAGAAAQLLVLDPEGERKRVRAMSHHAQHKWAAGGWRQRVVGAAREEIETGPVSEGATGSNVGLLALLSIAAPAKGEWEARLRALAEALDGIAGMTLAPYLDGGRVVTGFEGPGEAALAAIKVQERLAAHFPARIGGHYGLVETLNDPFSGGRRARPHRSSMPRDLRRRRARSASQTISRPRWHAAAAIGRRWAMSANWRRATGLRLACSRCAARYRIISSSRCGATIRKPSGERETMPRRSNMLIVRDAVARVVEARTATSDTTGAGRIRRVGRSGRRSHKAPRWRGRQ
jgi:tetratricopeptide (TPR) repeat protein